MPPKLTRSIAATVAIVIVAAVALHATRKPATPESRTERWRADVAFLQRELPRRHAKIYHTAARARLDSAFAATYAAVDSLTDHEIRMRLAQLTALVGDAHTEVAAVGPDAQRVPLYLVWFPDGIYVTHVRPGYERLLGARVVRVGNHRVELALRRASTALSHENDERVHANAPWLITYPSALHALGVAASPHAGPWTLVRPNGDTVTVALDPVNEAVGRWVPAVVDPPLYRRRSGEPFWFEHLDGTLYVRYRASREPVRFWRFANRVDDLLDNGNVRKVVLDVRENGGGNSLQFDKLLLGKLRNRRAMQFYAITDRSTFSAAVSNVITFRRATNAAVVCEAPGMAPNTYGEVEEVRLPHSGIPVRYATEFIMSDSTLGAARKLPVDIPIAVSAREYFAGVDPCLQHVLQDRRDAKNE